MYARHLLGAATGTRECVHGELLSRSYLQPWGNTKLFRYLLGWINPLNIALVKSYQPEWTMRLVLEALRRTTCQVLLQRECDSGLLSGHVPKELQDYLIPLTELKPMLDLGDDALGLPAISFASKDSQEAQDFVVQDAREPL